MMLAGTDVYSPSYTDRDMDPRYGIRDMLTDLYMSVSVCFLMCRGGYSGKGIWHIHAGL